MISVISMTRVPLLYGPMDNNNVVYVFWSNVLQLWNMNFKVDLSQWNKSVKSYIENHFYWIINF